MTRDYYSILSLDCNATQRQIKERFLLLARERHPDRFRGAEKAPAEEAFQAITEAFNVLNDPERRRRHDQELAGPRGEVTTLDPDHLLRVYLQRGTKAYRQGNYFEAAENFDRATRQDPKSASAWHHLARACSHQRRWLARATRAIAKACELEPMNPSYLKLAGRLFGQAGMRVRAERYYQHALRWGGEDGDVVLALEGLAKPSALARQG